MSNRAIKIRLAALLVVGLLFSGCTSSLDVRKTKRIYKKETDAGTKILAFAKKDSAIVIVGIGAVAANSVAKGKRPPPLKTVRMHIDEMRRAVNTISDVVPRMLENQRRFHAISKGYRKIYYENRRYGPARTLVRQMVTYIRTLQRASKQYQHHRDQLALLSQGVIPRMNSPQR
ncbi:MAG: hypothetical protein CMH54_09080 [Myxococcales bacterium]|nr:hypothetical protein [Myxococcales bacterium]